MLLDRHNPTSSAQDCPKISHTTARHRLGKPAVKKGNRKQRGSKKITCSAEASGVSGNVVGEYDRAHGRFARTTLAH